MKFNYKARTKEGELQVGNVEASSKEAATAILLSHGLFILSLEPVVEDTFWNRISEFLRKVKTTDLMVFTRQFATLLSSQVPLADSLANLYKQTTKPVLKETIYEIAMDIDAGFSLSQALSKHPGIFSEFYVNMVKSAEVTGRLSEVLNFLADYLEKQVALISKIKNALTYPIFVIVLFVIVLFIMVSMVFPQIIPILNESNIDLPFTTKVILSLSSFMSNWWWTIIIIFVGLLVILINYFQTQEGKVVKDIFVLKVPILGKMFQKLYISRFAESARVLIKGGLTIPQAVEISSRVIGNSVYQELLSNAAEGIRKGKLLSQVIAAMPEFPPLVAQLISVGEQTGRMEELLSKISDFYSKEVENTVENLVSLIQPVLMVVIGVIVAFLFAAMLLPIYSISKNF
jgi:type IV pilus assembly protein PilC